MTTGHGRIRDFSKPSTEKRVQIVGANEIQDPSTVQRLDAKTQGEGTPVEVRLHEETITEDDQIRRRKREPGEPEVRIRHSEGAKSFEKVKRLEDE